MIKRILALLVLCGLLGGGTWYLLRNTPEKEMERLQNKVQKLIFSEDPNDWEEAASREEREQSDLAKFEERAKIARRACEAILELMPNKRDVLELRAQIELLSGDAEGALQWYGRIAAQKNPPIDVALKRARIQRSLGRFTAAKQTLASAIDAYPFEVNLGLGQLQLETFQASEALAFFDRAIALAGNEEKNLREAYEGKADALNLIAGIDADSKSQSGQLLNDAIALWKKVRPQSREEFVNQQLKIAALHGKMNDLARIEEAIRILSEAVSSDEENRFVPVHLTLGTLHLEVAYGAKTEPEKRAEHVEEAQKHFLKALSRDAEGSVREIAGAIGWRLPSPMTKENFRGLVLQEICQALLGCPEYWRILEDRDGGGKKDALDVHERLMTMVDSRALSESRGRDLKILMALAFLKKGDDASFRKQRDELLKDLEEKDQVALNLQLAERCVRIKPQDLSLLDELLGPDLFREEEKAELSEEGDLRRILHTVRVIQQAKNHRLQKARTLEGGAAEDKKKNGEEIDRLLDRNRRLLGGIAKRARQPQMILLAARLMASLVSREESLAILEKGKEHFPADEAIGYALGMAHLLQAQQLGRQEKKAKPGEAADPALPPRSAESKEAWPHYRRALREFLVLFKAHPHQEDVLRRLFLIGERYKSAPGAPAMELQEILEQMFPKASAADTNALAGVLEGFIKRDFEAAIKNNPASGQNNNVRPFLNLVAGRCHLEQRNQIIAQYEAYNPESNLGLSAGEAQNSFSAFNHKALQEFEQAVKIDDGYLPAKLDLMRLELGEVQKGQNVPETLMGNIRGLVSANKDNAQAQYLLALALRKSREYFIVQPESRNKAFNYLLEERSVLRRAIQANPQYVEAYLALAATYVLGSRPPWIEGGPAAPRVAESFRSLTKPDFKKAITILNNAPPVPEVLYRLAHYYRGDREVEKSLKSFELLFYTEPTENNLSRLIHYGYVASGKFDEARNFLKQLKASAVPVEDWQITYHFLMALIASGEASSLSPTSVQRQEMASEEIDHYRAILERAKVLNLEPRPSAVNNLAYRLGEQAVKEGGKPESLQEPLALMEALIAKVRAGKVSLYLGSREDYEETYAWLLFKAGKFDRAEEIYKRLCANNPRPEFTLHFAELLFAQKKYDLADIQVNLSLKGNLEGEALEEANSLKSNIGQAIQDKREREHKFNR